MKFKEIEELVESKKKEIIDEEKEREMEDMIKFIEKEKLETIIDFITMDLIEFLKFFLYIKFNNKSLEECSYILDNFKKYCEMSDEDNIRYIVGTMLLLKENNLLAKTIEFLKSNDKVNGLKFLKEVKEVNISIPVTLMVIKHTTDIDLIPFIECIEENESIIKDIINFYYVHEEIKEFYDERVIIVRNNTLSEEENNRYIENVISEVLSGHYKIDALMDRLKVLKDYKEKYEKERRKKIKQIEDLDELKERLKELLKNKEIKSYHEFTRKIKDPSLRVAFLKCIKEHNEEYLNELTEEESYLKMNNKNRIEALLSQYDITKDDIDIDEITFKVEELEEILVILKSLLLDKDNMIRVIKTTSISNINKLKEFITRGILPVSFFVNNIEILDKNSNKLDIIKENIDILKRKGISVEIINNSLEILLEDSNIIENNLEILEKYDLLKFIKQDLDLRFLKDNNLEEKITIMNNLGYSKFLEEDITLLNENTHKRLLIYQILELEIKTLEELREVLNSKKKFFLKDDECNELIGRYSSENIKKLNLI